MNRDQFIATYSGSNAILYHKALSMLRSRDEAADIVQEVMAKLWEKREMMSEVRNPEAYAMQMVKNSSLDRLKSKQASHLHIVDDLQVESDDAYVLSAEREEKVDMVRRIVASLPEKQRQLIEMRDLKGYDMEEVELQLQLKPTAARVALSRARKALKEALEKEMNR
jgi:RNA polymerase sigma-70 factor (ECF subfamily)